MYKLHMNKLLLHLRRNCFIDKQFIWFRSIRLSQNKYVEYIHVILCTSRNNCRIIGDWRTTKNY